MTAPYADLQRKPLGPLQPGVNPVLRNQLGPLGGDPTGMGGVTQYTGGMVNSLGPISGGMPLPQQPPPTGVQVPSPTAPATGLQPQQPPPGAQVPPPNTPGQFGPGNDLRFSQFAPVGASPGTNQQLQNAQNQVAGFQGFGPYQGNPNQGQVSGLTGRAGNILGQGYQNFTGQALQNLQGAGNVGYGQAQNQLDLANQTLGRAGLQPSGLTQQATGLQGQLLGQIGQAPDRQALASQSLQQLAKDIAPQEQAAERQVTQNAAAAGQLGSGMAADRAQFVGNTYQQELARQAALLANQTAGQSLSDRLSQLGAAQSVGGQAFGQDVAQGQFGLQQAGARENLAAQQAGLAGNQFGQQLSLANAYQGLGAQNQAQQLAQAGANQSLANQLFGQGTTESQLGLGQQEANLGAQQGVLGQLAGLQGQEFGQGQQNFQNLQSQQQYQNAQAQQALQDRVAQFGLEQQAQNQAFGQNYDTNALLAQLGFGGASDATLGDVSGTYAQQGQDLLSGAGGILQNYFANQNPSQTAPATGQDTNSPFQFQPPAPQGYRWQNGQLVPG